MSWIEAENDIEILRGKAALVQRENDRLHKRLAVLSALVDKLEGQDAETLQTELKLLTEQLSAQRAREFGPSSERRTKSKDDPPSQPRTGHGPTEQPVLPFEEVVHPIGAQDPCELCGGAVELWAGQTEDSEEVTVVERKFVIIRHRRQKARCKCGGCVRTAPAPAKLIVGGRYSLAFAVAIAVQKYLYHLPLQTLDAMKSTRSPATCNPATKRCGCSFLPRPSSEPTRRPGRCLLARRSGGRGQSVGQMPSTMLSTPREATKRPVERSPTLAAR